MAGACVCVVCVHVVICTCGTKKSGLVHVTCMTSCALRVRELAGWYVCVRAGVGCARARVFSCLIR